MRPEPARDGRGGDDGPPRARRRPVVAPPAVVDALLAFADVDVVPDSPGLTARDLDAVDAVVTGCALAIADTGVIVLDGDRWCGRRAITLVPDLHVCVVRLDHVVGLVPGRSPGWIRPGRRPGSPAPARRATSSSTGSRACTARELWSSCWPAEAARQPLAAPCASRQRAIRPLPRDFGDRVHEGFGLAGGHHGPGIEAVEGEDDPAVHRRPGGQGIGLARAGRDDPGFLTADDRRSMTAYAVRVASTIDASWRISGRFISRNNSWWLSANRAYALLVRRNCSSASSPLVDAARSSATVQLLEAQHCHGLDERRLVGEVMIGRRITHPARLATSRMVTASGPPSFNRPSPASSRARRRSPW